MLFSHLRTPDQYLQYVDTYRRAGGAGKIAINRPVYVGESDSIAWAEAEEAVRILCRRFRAEGKISANTPEPSSVRECCGHPLNFTIGSAASVARALQELHGDVPFDVANLEVRWAGLSHELVGRSLDRLGTQVPPVLR